MSKRQPEWSRDIATFKGSAFRSSRHAFRDAGYACAIERGSSFYRVAEYVWAVLVISCLGLMIGAALAWMI